MKNQNWLRKSFQRPLTFIKKCPNLVSIFGQANVQISGQRRDITMSEKWGIDHEDMIILIYIYIIYIINLNYTHEALNISKPSSLVLPSFQTKPRCPQLW